MIHLLLTTACIFVGQFALAEHQPTIQGSVAIDGFAPWPSERDDWPDEGPIGRGPGEERDGWYPGRDYLSEEAEKLIDTTMREVRKKNRVLRAKLFNAQDEAYEILVADTFEKEKFEAKHAEIMTIKNEMMTNRTQATATIASQLKKEERQFFAGDVGGGPPRFGPGRGRH